MTVPTTLLARSLRGLTELKMVFRKDTIIGETQYRTDDPVPDGIAVNTLAKWLDNRRVRVVDHDEFAAIVNARRPVKHEERQEQARSASLDETLHKLMTRQRNALTQEQADQLVADVRADLPRDDVLAKYHLSPSAYKVISNAVAQQPDHS